MKEEYFEFEEKYLSPFAKKSKDAGKREYEIDECPYRTDYRRDRDRILHSKSFRRLIHKTQVFLAPEGDHYRTRLTHTLEVAQIASSIARALKLNEDLTEAISLGHDLGHTPFGHAGENALNNITGDFKHNKQSLRIVEILENNGKGLNLTPEVRDGILNHRKELKPSTLEGMVVNYADRIAYINHDIDDAIEANLLKEKDLPSSCIECLGNTKTKRINILISDIIKESNNKNFVKMSDSVETQFKILREFMFENVYKNKIIKRQTDKAEELIKLLYEYYDKNPSKLKKSVVNEEKIEVRICDYIASMTDRFAIRTFENIYIPEKWRAYPKLEEK